MIAGYPKEELAHVKFISYSGQYPNLCNGTLTLEIDGIQYKFCSCGYDNKTSFPRFWSSGGSVSPDCLTTVAEWEVYYTAIPEQFKKYALIIDRVFNENVEYGCCGGCS